MFQEYPKWLHHVAKTSVVVKDAAEEAEKAAEGYVVKLAHAGAAPQAAAPSAPAPAPVAAPSGNTGIVPGDVVVEAEKSELYATDESAVIAKLKDSSKATLEKVLAYEEANPNGPRPALVKAVKAALKPAKPKAPKKAKKAPATPAPAAPPAE